MEYSVLMTVYKSDNPVFFDKAIKSMLEQTRKPEELVLVKDGPVPDAIQRIVDKYDNQFPGVITQVQLERNVGLGLALNEGIKVARNELLARMDADDISMPERCDKQVQEFEKDSSLDIVGSPVIEFVDDINQTVGRRDVPLTNDAIYKYARKRDPFNHPAVMYRKSKVVQSGMYGDLRKNQDTDLWIKMLLNNAKCKNIEEPLLWFRFDNNTYAKRKNWLNTKLLIAIRWNAYKSKFCSLWDFLQVAVMQLGIYILPVSFQKFIYTKFLR